MIVRPLLVLLFCTCSFSLEVLTLDKLLISVKKDYPLVNAAEFDIDSARAEETSFEGAFDLIWKNRATSNNFGYYENYRIDSVLEKPIPFAGVNFFTGYRLGTGSFPIYDEKFLTLPIGELRAGLEVSLWRNRPIDRRRSNLAKAQLGITVAEANAIQARLEAIRNATLKFWDWVAAGIRKEIYRKLLLTAEDRDKGIAERVRQGDLPEFERKDNERAILQRKAQLIAAERSLQQFAIELSLFYRDAEGNSKYPEDQMLPNYIVKPEPVKNDRLVEYIQQALRVRPEIQRLLSMAKQNEIERDFADNQISPRVDLQVGVSRDLGSGDSRRLGTELEASLLLEIPIETRLARGRRESASATRNRILATEKLMRDRVVAEVKDSMSSLNAAYGRVQVAESETMLARKLEEGERDRFKHGDSNILFVNLREQATADALVRETEALADYQKGRAQLKAAIGEVF